MKKTFIILVFMSFIAVSSAQTYANKPKAKTDTTAYNYILPIWGSKAHALGFDLPYSAGIGINYIAQKSDLIISNVNIGLNNGPMYDIDELVRFKTTSSASQGVNIRPDIWLFPFLNVYGILAQAHSTTNVDVGIWIPRTNSSEELFSIQTSPEFNSTSYGFGLTPTLGFFNGWIALDMNVTWTDVDALDKPVFIFIFDPRIGKTFSLKKPERNVSVWVGGTRLKVNRNTNGNMNLNEILPTNEWEEKIGLGQDKVGEAQIELDQWWVELTPIEQKNPVNKAKYESNSIKLDVAGKTLYQLESALNTADESTLQYKLDKKQKTKWNFMVGSQFQINKNWMIRGEYGFLTSRQHLFVSMQYRFGL